jgi:hypothetical protein
MTIIKQRCRCQFVYSVIEIRYCYDHSQREKSLHQNCLIMLRALPEFIALLTIAECTKPNSEIGFRLRGGHQREKDFWLIQADSL